MILPPETARSQLVCDKERQTERSELECNKPLRKTKASIANMIVPEPKHHFHLFAYITQDLPLYVR